MPLNINSRQNELILLEKYLKEFDTEITMILQNLQWDRNHLEEKRRMVVCQYDSNHRLPPDKLADHEKKCFLTSHGYTHRDRLLPSPVDPEAATLVKLNGANIAKIINDASDRSSVPMIGASCDAPEPLSLERLQATYSTAQRRALHDAVVARAPAPSALADLVPMSVKGEGGEKARAQSRMELEAQLRDLRRRRARYRVPAKTRNYSAALRDVIVAQMELLNQTQDKSVDDMHVKADDSASKINAQNDITPKQKANIVHDDTSSKNYHSKERKALSSSEDRYNESRHATYYENRKRRHVESGSNHDYSSSKHYKTKEFDGSRSNSTNEYKDHRYISKTKRVDDRHSGYKESKEQIKKYDDYNSRKQHRDKDDGHRKKARTDDNLHPSRRSEKVTRDDDRDDDHEKYQSSKRHPSSREKKDSTRLKADGK